MNKSNCFITDSNQNVVFIGENVLRHVECDSYFCYPAGKIEKGDIFILISACPDDFSFLSRQFGIRASDISFSDSAVIIGKISSSDQSTVIKRDCFDDEALWLSIIYERKLIKIQRHDDLISININEKSLILDLNQASQSLIIINDDRIKYFKFSEGNIRSDLLRLSSDNSFSSYFNGDFSRKLLLDDIIPPSLKQALDEKKDHIRLGNELLYISSGTLPLDREYTFYCLESAETIKENIIAENLKHSNITNIENIYECEKMQYNNFRLWGEGSNLKQLEKRLQKGSVTNATILLTGESGTGKTFLAREIHNASRRKNNPFIHVNCAAIPSQLIESELFGYEEGAFSGARKGGKKGFFDLAYGGTLFLDEISEIPLQLQSKLLEVLQNKTFYPIGATSKHVADARLIVATNRDLGKMVSEKTFREDLYYRINVFPITLPPLRERMDIINTLVSDILPEICDRLEIAPLLIDYTALEKIRSYSWPGNVRELENILEIAAILSDGSIIMPDDIYLPKTAEDTFAPESLKDYLYDAERRIIIDTLRHCSGDKIAAAKHLGISRSSIFEKIRKYNIQEELWNYDFK